MIRKALLGVICSSIIISLKGAVPLADVVNTPSNTVNVTVPSSLNLVFNSDGSNSLDSLSIGNESLVPITIGNISASLYNDWRLVPSDSIISKDTKELSFTIEGKDLASGDNSYSIEIGSKSEKDLGVMIKRGAWSNSISEKALDLAINYDIGKSDFTLSFDSSGGSDIENISAKNGDTIVLPTPSKVGYTFLGWKSSSGVVYDGGSSYVMPIGGDTFIAQWRVNKLYIQYSMNGGTLKDPHGSQYSSDSDGFVLKSGNKIIHTLEYGGTAPSDSGLADYNSQAHINIYKEGYHALDGLEWNTEADGSGKSFNQHTIYKTSDLADLSNGDVTLTLYVNWKPIKYTINFDGNWGEGGSTTSMNVDYGSSVNLSSNGFYKNAHTFTDWNTSPYGTGTSYANEQEIKNLSNKNGDTITLYAQWEPNSISFNFKPENGESNYSLNGVLGDMYDLTIPVKNGYDFSGWGKSDYYGLFGKYVKNNTFEKGSLSGIEVYKLGHSNSSLYGRMELVGSSNDNPTDSNYEVEIIASTPYMSNGVATYTGFCTPFYSGTFTNPSTSYIHTFKAKIPKGVKIESATNALGLGGKIYWYTEKYGTGEWETYSYRADLGEGADASAIGYIYVASIDDSVVNLPFSWNLAYSKIMEVTNIPTDPVLLLGSKDNTLTAKWVNIDYNINYDLDGGTNPSNAKTSYSIGTDYTLPIPNKSGYSFLGWNEFYKMSDWNPGDLNNSPGDGGIVVSNRGAYFSEYIPVKSGYTYSWNNEVNGHAVGSRFYDSNHYYKYYATSDYSSYTPSEDGYMRFLIVDYSKGDEDYLKVFEKSPSGYVTSIKPTDIGDRNFVANWSINSYYLDVQGVLDGVYKNNTYEYGVFDVYINGVLDSANVYDYWKKHPYGTTYEIRNIKSLTGKTYIGLSHGTLKGTINASDTGVGLKFNTNTFTVKYESNGADSGTMGTTTVTYGNPTPLEKNKFIKKGYSFGGWVAKRRSDSKVRYRSVDGTDTGWYLEGQQPSGWSYYIYNDETEIYAASSIDKDIITMSALWVISSESNYTVNHYSMNLDGSTYSLAETENLQGVSNTSLVLESLKKDYTGFTYKEGKSGNNIVSSVNINSDGSTVIDLYYSRNIYNLDVGAWFDGFQIGMIPTLGTFDITINGKKNIGVTDFNKPVYYGSNFHIDNIKLNPGYEYLGFYTGSIPLGDGVVFAIDGSNNTMPAQDSYVDLEVVSTIYSIYYNLDGGTALNNPNSYSVKSETITLNNPTKSGYTFTGWSEKIVPKEWYDGFIDLSNGTINNINPDWLNSVFTGFIKVEGGKTYTVDGFEGTVYGNLRIRAYDNSLNYLGCVGEEGLYQSSGVGFNPSNTYTPEQDGYVRLMLSSSSYKDNIVISNSEISDTVRIYKGSTGNKVYSANWSFVTK